jgi:FG-GAP-like repeat
MEKPQSLAALALVVAMFGGAASAVAGDVFEPPVRLKADGQVIDTGPQWGHSSPCVIDLNGDGVKDLLIGDFGGKFHRYLNVGKPNAPEYRGDGLLQAGGVEAEVRIYCCIGAQARFHDLDGDGVADMIANSYDPGHCYLFRGRPNNQFAAVEEMRDKSGVPIRSAPVQKQNYQSFGSFYDAVDWDGDGDLDLLIGCFSGELKVRINEGDAKSPRFATENLAVKTAAGEPLKVKAHFCPVVADWDGDGVWDIIAGSDDGSVTWFRNTGSKTSPVFAAGQELVKKHEGNGYDILAWNDADIVPGIRAQPEVFDYNGDGKLDLLVGDFYTAYDFKRDLSDEQKKQVEEMVATGQAGNKAFAKKMEALQEDFRKRYPGDEIFSDKADKEWSTAYHALRESPEAKQMEADEKTFTQKMRPFLASTHGEGERDFDLAKSHGHVWVFIRK